MADISKVQVGGVEYNVKDETARERVRQLSEATVALPKDADGAAITGTDGQFAVSDGAGGIQWVTIANATGVSF